MDDDRNPAQPWLNLAPDYELARAETDSLDQITLARRPYTVSDVINVFNAAGPWIETAIEPQLSDEARRRYPHKQVWMNKYLGILIFKLRAHLGQQAPQPVRNRIWC